MILLFILFARSHRYLGPAMQQKNIYQKNSPCPKPCAELWVAKCHRFLALTGPLLATIYDINRSLLTQFFTQSLQQCHNRHSGLWVPCINSWWQKAKSRVKLGTSPGRRREALLSFNNVLLLARPKKCISIKACLWMPEVFPSFLTMAINIQWRPMWG